MIPSKYKYISISCLIKNFIAADIADGAEKRNQEISAWKESIQQVEVECCICCFYCCPDADEFIMRIHQQAEIQVLHSSTHDDNDVVSNEQTTAISTVTSTPQQDVIVYLAQFGHHSSYGAQTDGRNPITGVSKLN